MARYTLYIYVAIWLSSLVYVIQGDTNATDISQFHFSSERLGCKSVVSEYICPASELSPDLALDYETDAEMVNLTLEDIKANNASQECISAIITTYCSVFTPRCFVNGSRDYVDARKACWKANRTCPVDSIEEGFCESLKVGLQPLSACVKPSKPINGSCPQPKFKMPEDKLDLYIMSSKGYENSGYFENLTTARFPNGSRMFSNGCVSKIKELYCLPFYCSTNEQQIVVEYTYEDCDDIFYYKCFGTALAELYEGPLKEAILDLQDRYDNCGFYPYAIESPGMGSGTPPVDIPTSQSMSTAPPGKNVSTTTQKEIPSTTPLMENATSTTLGKNISTTPGQNISTTPRENRSTTLPGMTTSQPEDTKTFTTLTKDVEILETPSPTGGNERCQNVPTLLLFFLLVLVHINM